MKKLKFFVIAAFVLLVFSMQLTQCSTKPALRENSDDSGNPDAWNASIIENANEMLDIRKGCIPV